MATFNSRAKEEMQNAPVWRVRSDDYSLQAVSDQHRLFWIRIESPVSGEIVVSDFKSGGLGDTQLAEAMAALVEAGGLDVLRRPMRFKDIAPGGDESAARLAAEDIAVKLVVIGERLAVRVEALDFQARGDKYNLLASFMPE